MDNKVLVTIAGREITERDLEAIISRYPQDKRAYFDSEMGRKQLLEQLVSFELMNKLGTEMELDKTEEYKSALEQMERDLLTQMTINKVLSDVTVTDADAETFYNEHAEEFKTPETVSSKHILVDSEEKAKEIKEKFGCLSQNELIRYTYINYPYYATKSTIAINLLNEEELAVIDKQKRTFTEPQLFTIGYEGRSLEKYINILLVNDVHILCDVRKNAYSQKYGFSKSQLEKACTGVGIKYIHIPQLGIESEQRQDLKSQKDYEILFESYASINGILSTFHQQLS